LGLILLTPKSVQILGGISMNREEALTKVKKYVKNKNLIKHMLATESIMRALAKRFNEDEEKWGLAGLLHDIDYELTEKEPEKQQPPCRRVIERR